MTSNQELGIIQSILGNTTLGKHGGCAWKSAVTGVAMLSCTQFIGVDRRMERATILPGLYKTRLGIIQIAALKLSRRLAGLLKVKFSCFLDASGPIAQAAWNGFCMRQNGQYFGAAVPTSQNVVAFNTLGDSL